MPAVFRVGSRSLVPVFGHLRRGQILTFPCPGLHPGHPGNILETGDSVIPVSRLDLFFKKFSPSPPSIAVHPTGHPSSTDFISASGAFAIPPSSNFVHVASSYPRHLSDTFRLDGRGRYFAIFQFPIVPILPSIFWTTLPISEIAGARYFPYDPGLNIFLALSPAIISPRRGARPVFGSFFQPGAQAFGLSPLRGTPRL